MDSLTDAYKKEYMAQFYYPKNNLFDIGELKVYKMPPVCLKIELGPLTLDHIRTIIIEQLEKLQSKMESIVKTTKGVVATELLPPETIYFYDIGEENAKYKQEILSRLCNEKLNLHKVETLPDIGLVLHGQTAGIKNLTVRIFSQDSKKLDEILTSVEMEYFRRSPKDDNLSFNEWNKLRMGKIIADNPDKHYAMHSNLKDIVEISEETIKEVMVNGFCPGNLNYTFPTGTITESLEYKPGKVWVAPTECICSSMDIFNFGCKCGYISQTLKKESD